jgi:hypothetical protein
MTFEFMGTKLLSFTMKLILLCDMKTNIHEVFHTTPRGNLKKKLHSSRVQATETFF